MLTAAAVGVVVAMVVVFGENASALMLLIHSAFTTGKVKVSVG